jgi:hypothetical protein
LKFRWTNAVKNAIRTWFACASIGARIWFTNTT